MLGLPDDLFIEELPAACPQLVDDAVPVREVVPEPPGVEHHQLIFDVPGQFAQAPIVKQQPPLLIDDGHSRWAIVQNLAKLALLFGGLCFVLRQSGNVIDPDNAFATDETDMPTVVSDLHVGEKEVNKAACLGSPYHPLVENLTTLVSQLIDDLLALLDVMPMRTRVAKIELLLAVAEYLAQTGIVKEQSTVLVDHDERSRAKFQ